MEREKRFPMRNFSAASIVRFLLGMSVLVGLFMASRHSYLLFHSLAEIFSIVVACSIFVVFWNSRYFLRNGYFLFIGIAYLFVGGMDLLHTISYTGMGVFPEHDTNLPTQLWIAARYLESLSFLIAVLFLRYRLKATYVFVGYALIVSFLIGSIFYWNIFPACFTVGVGLTPFKKISEYFVSLVFLVSIAILFRRKREFDPLVWRLFIASIMVTVASELTFTFYVHAYSLFNLIGHFLKLISFYLIYKAFIEVGLRQPYHLLFRDLRQSEEKYRDLVENMNDVIYAIDKNGVMTYVSPAVESFIGYKPSEVMGRSLRKFVHQEDVPHIEEGLRTVLSGQAAANEYRILSKSGEVRWMRTSSRPIFAGDRVVGVSGVLADITERKLAEEALQQSERELGIKNRIASVFLTTPDEEIYGDVLQIILETMESTYGIFGYIDEHESLIIPSMTRDIWDECQVPNKTIVFPRETWGGIWGRALVEKRSLYANEGLNVPRGHVPITQVLVVPILYNREVIGLLEVANKAADYGEKDKAFLEAIAGRMAPVLSARLQRDRQERERKQAEEALHKSEERLMRFIESATDSLTLLDSTLHLIEINEIGLKRLDLKKEDVVGKHLLDLEPGLKKSGRYQKYLEVVKTGIPYSADEHVRHPEGRDMHLAVKAFKVGDGLGIIATDITERKLLEKDLKRMTKTLELKVKERTEELMSAQLHLAQSQKLAGLGQLAAGVSHELRNPLGIINASLYFLKRSTKLEDPTIQKHIKIMEEEVKRSSKIVESLLEFARRSPQEMEEIDINELLNKTLFLLEKEFLTNDVIIRTHFEPLPKVNFQRDDLKQVFLNVMLNASQAMPNGGELRIRTKLREDGGANTCVEIVFHDTGVGIPKEDLTDIFNPFFTTKEKGVGLGLSLVHAAVNRYGGNVRITSQVGKGTTVTLTLPVSQNEHNRHTG